MTLIEYLKKVNDILHDVHSTSIPNTDGYELMQQLNIDANKFSLGVSIDPEIVYDVRLRSKEIDGYYLNDEI